MASTLLAGATALGIFGSVVACQLKHHPVLQAPYADESLSPAVRVLLVAGGDDVANFAAEVVAQRRLWLAAGLQPEQIACYWAKPRGQALREDRRQYRALLPELAPCRSASPSRLLADLEFLATEQPEWIYLYISAHGIPRLGGSGTQLRLSPAEVALARRPALALDGDRTRRVDQFSGLIHAWRQGASEASLAVTPESLGAALTRFPDTTAKLVVLQACYSGDFVGDGDGGLAAVPNITLLTATAAGRPSFGCNAGRRTTFWGGALLQSLTKFAGQGLGPDEVPWAVVYSEVVDRVGQLERRYRARPSLPQLCTNHRDPPGCDQAR